MEKTKFFMKHHGLVPVVILLSDKLHFDMFVENVNESGTAIMNVSKNIVQTFENPSFTIYKYESYEQVINVMAEHKTEVVWECLNNWRVM